MKTAEWKKQALSKLKNNEYYKEDEEYWLNDLLSKLLESFNVEFKEELSESNINLLDERLEELLTGKPLAQVIGFTYFYGNRINVYENVLIPRPDSEVLVETVLNYSHSLLSKSNLQNRKIRLLEIGSGSGALSIAIAKEFISLGLEFEILASDISIDAINATKNNIVLNNLSQYIRVEYADIWPEKVLNGDYVPDLIFSNPPYIDAIEKEVLELIEHEPIEALVADDSGLYFYREILNSEFVKQGCIIIFEHGYKQADKIKIIADETEHIKFISSKEDIAGRTRVSEYIRLW